ncbi:hypothetical protein D918_00094 [Trichuris suis]|nr:hypothetical protein D918_00094 [Trichuris suis]
MREMISSLCASDNDRPTGSKEDKEELPADQKDTEENSLSLESAEPEVLSQQEDETPSSEETETLDLVVSYKREKLNVSLPAISTIKKLKETLETLTGNAFRFAPGVPRDMQKLTTKCSLRNEDATLKSLQISSGTKFLLIGSKPEQITEAVAGPPKGNKLDVPKMTSIHLCDQTPHAKILEKGKPDDVMVGIKDFKDTLPLQPITGMLNKYGRKTRLSFKLDIDELWISTKERTEKIQMNRIRSVVAEPIDGHEDYYIMGLQLGTTEASRYWLYWVPAQFVDAIKKTILN